MTLYLTETESTKRTRKSNKKTRTFTVENQCGAIFEIEIDITTAITPIENQCAASADEHRIGPSLWDVLNGD
jgi:hypothetical protein